MKHCGSAVRLRHVSFSAGMTLSWGCRFSSTLVSTPLAKGESGARASRQRSITAIKHSSLRETRGVSRRGSAALTVQSVGPSPTLSPQGTCYNEDSDRTENLVKTLSKLLRSCIDMPSAERYEGLTASTAALYKIAPSRHWLLHSRALVNYGVQCLVDQKPDQAVSLLRQAIEVILFFGEETSVVHLRVMLANALACERRYFEALCQYEAALTVMRDFPVESSLQQLISGHEMWMPLSRDYVMEDFDRFLACEKASLRALSQGNKLVNGSTDNSKKARVAFSMARLQRRRGEKDASMALYTVALRALLESPNPDLELQVLHDIGLLLCFEVFDVARGLPYLKSAAEMSFDRAREVLKEEQARRDAGDESEGISREGYFRIRHAVFVLIDTAVCFAENNQVGKALGFFEECLSLMSKCGMKQHSAWVRMKYADALARASLTDKAIRVYLKAMDMVQVADVKDDGAQLACMGMAVLLTRSEVEGRLAYCFQTRVGDYRRACVHFCQSLRRCGVAIDCPFKVSEEAATECCEEVDVESLRWMLGKYADCCVRVGNREIAKKALEHCINVERSVGGYSGSALLRLAQLYSTDNVARSLEIYIHLLSLPQDAIEPNTLLRTAYDFIALCYENSDDELETALARATTVTTSEEKHPSFRAVPATMSSELESSSPDAIIISSFKKSASVILASRSVNKLKPRFKRNEELKILMALSRAGFFCQRRGYDAGAEDMYRLAVDYARVSKMKCEEYSRELAIMLANYATVVAHRDAQLAKTLYEQAVTTCPREENVSNAAASFFVLTANYAEGRACIERLVNASDDHAVRSRLYGKLAWLGVVCWDELLHHERDECLQHLLLALGTNPTEVALKIGDTPGSQLKKPLSEDFKRFLLLGIAQSNDQETVSLAGYVAQTKLYHEGKFINACYKAALSRFPSTATILVNYAKFCGDYGATVLARKYYSKAFVLSQTDPRIGECYADYLAFLNGEEQQLTEHQRQQPQVVSGESLVRYQRDRFSHEAGSLAQAQSLSLYGKYVAMCMPCPSIPTISFEEALRRNPGDSRATVLYCSFLWNVYSTALDTKSSPGVKQCLANKVASCYLSCLKYQPDCVPLLTGLGSLYIDMGGRFSEAVQVLEKARGLSPNNVTVYRLLCAAFHEEWTAEQQRAVPQGRSRLQYLLDALRHLYEKASTLDPTDRLTLAKYCQFALHGLRDKNLVAQLVQQLRELSKE
ncbi:hypothetical protein ERJ75_000213300 [Trypanosoma vivax]|uniref:Uncharacterized protein n=1 Tax=Trypanosoma vivax (strain Y486) TaxID=1055687 RepID=G0U9V8_TRYVY|nr:hypothetical protein TRVL_02109 [Trypanosoma vivax]KAH8619074.1 hypothetical protein ERJ75_000213300 [Trypanosoma vivax]CCC52589.1 conserved hypothetical protein [Trypanosoma vivax Y486]